MNELFLSEIRIDWSGIAADSYLRQIPAIVSLDTLSFRQPVTFFTGENGSGKSTLLEAIAAAYGFNPEGGSWNYCFSTYDSHSSLCDGIRLIKGFRKPKWGYFLRAESFYNVATAEEEYSKQKKFGAPEYYHRCSHGESFLKLIQNNFSDEGLYFLDEPEAALSPQRQLTLLLEIAQCAKHGSQFMIATHSPILLGLPDAEILRFDDKTIAACQYEDTESYCITKMFLERREQILKQMELV